MGSETSKAHSGCFFPTAVLKKLRNKNKYGSIRMPLATDRRMMVMASKPATEQQVIIVPVSTEFEGYKKYSDFDYSKINELQDDVQDEVQQMKPLEKEEQQCETEQEKKQVEHESQEEPVYLKDNEEQNMKNKVIKDSFISSKQIIIIEVDEIRESIEKFSRGFKMLKLFGEGGVKCLQIRDEYRICGDVGFNWKLKEDTYSDTSISELEKIDERQDGISTDAEKSAVKSTEIVNLPSKSMQLFDWRSMLLKRGIIGDKLEEYEHEIGEIVDYLSTIFKDIEEGDIRQFGNILPTIMNATIEFSKTCDDSCATNNDGVEMSNKTEIDTNEHVKPSIDLDAELRGDASSHFVYVDNSGIDEFHEIVDDDAKFVIADEEDLSNGRNDLPDNQAIGLNSISKFEETHNAITAVATSTGILQGIPGNFTEYLDVQNSREFIGNCENNELLCHKNFEYKNENKEFNMLKAKFDMDDAISTKFNSSCKFNIYPSFSPVSSKGDANLSILPVYSEFKQFVGAIGRPSNRKSHRKTLKGLC